MNEHQVPVDMIPEIAAIVDDAVRFSSAVLSLTEAIHDLHLVVLGKSMEVHHE